jgi:hypothetical protein
MADEDIYSRIQSLVDEEHSLTGTDVAADVCPRPVTEVEGYLQ